MDYDVDRLSEEERTDLFMEFFHSQRDIGMPFPYYPMRSRAFETLHNMHVVDAPPPREQRGGVDFPLGVPDFAAWEVWWTERRERPTPIVFRYGQRERNRL